MNTTATETDQLDMADRRALDAVRWSQSLSLYQLIILIPGLALAITMGMTGNAQFGWVVAGYFSLLTITVLTVRWVSAKNDDQLPDVTVWRRYFLLYAAAVGAGWGACALLFIEPDSPRSLYLITSLTLAAMAAGVVLFSCSFLAQCLFTLTAVLPLTVTLAVTDLWTLPASVTALLTALVVMFCTSRPGGLFDDRSRLRRQVEEQAVALGKAQDQAAQAEGARQRMARERNAIKEEMGELSRQAQQAGLAKDEFLATVSHEIRTPLNGILPLLDLMRGSELNEEQRAHMSTILSSSRHLLTIIDSMLDYSKMQAGKLELETVGFNLNELVDSVTKLLGQSAARKNVALKSHIDTGVRAAVRGDPVRLRQILTNLVSNAVKFTEDGMVQINVTTRSESVAEYRLRFSIKDTGVGIDEDTIEKLFQPFTQADASVTRNFGGSGMGLVICKQMVELMGGDIGVVSKKNKGSEFWFEIPLKKAVGDIAPEARKLAGVRMLMVTNDEVFQNRAARFAQNSGCNVDLASSPQDAVGKVKRGHDEGGYNDIDLLAIDATSTGPQGLVLAKKLSNHPKIGRPCLILNAGGKVPESLKTLDNISAVSASCSTEQLAEAISELVERTADATAEQTQRAVDANEYVEIQTIKARVLLVEDNHINLNVATTLMKSLGLEFEVATNGREALAAMEKGHFDAALMDCMMPIMDGYTATRQWREIEERNNLARLPIIAMTANAMSGDVEKCLGAGMDAYLSKPLDRQLIAETLRRLMAHAEDGSESATDPLDALQGTHRSSKTATPSASLKQEAGKDLDEATLQKLCQLMGTGLDELVQSYIADAPEGIKKIRQALRAQNLEQVAAHAHELKSTSASLGAVSVRNLCETIEVAAAESKVEQVRQMLELLPACVETTSGALKTFKPVAA